MKASRARSKIFFRSIALPCLVFALAGCYQGFKRPGAAAGGGANPFAQGASEKPFGLAILDVIYPTQEAMTGWRCGHVSTGEADLRLYEIAARIKAMRTLLNAQADSLRVVTTTIGPDDCQSFAPLVTRASTASKELDVGIDLKVKTALHVRLVLWFGDNSWETPSRAVVAKEWADFKSLAPQGFVKRLSVNDFYELGPEYGYIWRWYDQAPENVTYTSDTLEHLSIGENGVAEINEAVVKGTREFGEWLADRARGR